MNLIKYGLNVYHYQDYFGKRCGRKRLRHSSYGEIEWHGHDIRRWIRGRCQMYQPRRDIFLMKGTLIKINCSWMLTLNKNPPIRSNDRILSKGKGQ